MIAVTTLSAIRKHKLCTKSWKKLLAHLGKRRADSKPLPLSVILASNGIDDALWALRACDGINRQARLFAVACARKMQHLMTDPRFVAAVDVAERYVNCEATDEELTAARDAAEKAVWDQEVVAVGVLSAALAARAAVSTASKDAWFAALTAARVMPNATWETAVESAWKVTEAARASVYAAGVAAKTADREWQRDLFVEMFCKEEA